MMSKFEVTPSRVCELKYVWDETKGNDEVVTPSRVCELKCKLLTFLAD